MEQAKLQEILQAHKKWLAGDYKEGARADLSGADLRNADLRGADLRGADLRGANLDFSCFPLWCGGLNMHIDDRLARQLLYHLLRNVAYSKNTSDEMKSLLFTPELISAANQFHRVDECGRIAQQEVTT